jgi:hypothetical protein
MPHRNPRIALLDDEPATRELLVELFTALGYEIEADVSAADVVVADLPPSRSTFRLEYLQFRNPGAPLVVTTRGSRHEARRLARYGIALRQIVFKPYDVPAVARTVASELDRRARRM